MSPDSTTTPHRSTAIFLPFHRANKKTPDPPVFILLFLIQLHHFLISLCFPLISALPHLTTMSAIAANRVSVIMNHLSSSASHPAGLLAGQVAIVTGAGYVCDAGKKQHLPDILLSRLHACI
jgi:hypothetical protein